MAVSKRLRFEVLRRDGHRCRYCGATAPDVKLTVDHVIPVALGGSDKPTNLATACEPCNSGKSSVPADAPIVESVKDDAFRWAAAMKQAAEQARADFEARAEYRATFRESWDRWKAGKVPVPLDGAWELSIDSLRQAGLPDWELNEAVLAAMKAEKIKAGNKFRYFCGICWTKIRSLQADAHRIVGGDSSATDEAEKELQTGRLAKLVADAWKTQREELGFPVSEEQESSVSWQAYSWICRGVDVEELVASAKLAASRRVMTLSHFFGWEGSLRDGVEKYYEACSRLHNAAYTAESMSPGDVLAAMEVLASTFETVSRSLHRFSEVAEDIDQQRILDEASRAVMAPRELIDELFPDDYPWSWSTWHEVEWPTAFWHPWEPPPARRKAPLPEWCGQCDGGDTLAMRWIDVADGEFGCKRGGRARCPRCNPYSPLYPLPA